MKRLALVLALVGIASASYAIDDIDRTNDRTSLVRGEGPPSSEPFILNDPDYNENTGSLEQRPGMSGSGVYDDDRRYFQWEHWDKFQEEANRPIPPMSGDRSR